MVVGDVVVIEPGKTIPADCVLIHGVNISVNESALTGETETVHKSHVTVSNYSHNPCPFILQSTLVESGEGRALVCAVGENT